MDNNDNLDLAEDRYYELGFLVKEESSEPVKKILQKNNAVVFEESALTKVSLAYPIKKEKMAFFGYCRFTALPEAAAVIQEALKFQPEVLRVIFIKLSESAVRAAKANQGEIKRPVRRREAEVKKEGSESGLSNEDLEKKIEEILNI